MIVAEELGAREREEIVRVRTSLGQGVLGEPSVKVLLLDFALDEL